MVRKAAARALFPLCAALLACAASAQTQNQPRNAAPQQPAQSGPSAYTTPIGPSIGVDAAKKAAAAAAAEARKNGWFMAIAVVDPAGTLVYYEKADNTQPATANVGLGKARSAAPYKRPPNAMQDGPAPGGNRLPHPSLEDGGPVQGGVPL